MGTAFKWVLSPALIRELHNCWLSTQGGERLQTSTGFGVQNLTLGVRGFMQVPLPGANDEV